MKKVKGMFGVCLLGILAIQPLSGQTRGEREIMKNPRLATGKYLAYQAPSEELTPAPEGYMPCYISTYARHGSRYLTGADKYEPALYALEKAMKENGLTQYGIRTLEIVRALAGAARDRYGELTPKGARQHQELATRMFTNYPEIFVDGTHVDARSTYKTRAFLSMTAACVTLKGLNPALNVTTDASQYDAYYLKYKNPVYSDSCQKQADSLFAEARRRFVHPDRLMKQLFRDSYLPEVEDPVKLACDLFEYHGISQSSDNMPDLAFLFTPDELFDFWQLNNFEWYYEKGASPLSDACMYKLERNLLKNFVETADTVIASKKKAVTLRYGHDTNLAPLAVLMGINRLSVSTPDWYQIADTYRTYRIIPMCGNIQLIFYRKHKGGDILVRLLLNEREVTLPLETDVAPFYHWKDLRKYWSDLIRRIELPETVH